MNIMPDYWIREMAKKKGMIEPFVEKNFSSGVVSYGVSSYGYDASLDDTFKIFTNLSSSVIDPKSFPEDSFLSHKGKELIIPPNGFVLAKTVERFKIPRNVIAICLGKSTYARCGLIVNVTPLEPEWEGYVTVELSNTAPLPIKVYANEGICQMIFISTKEGRECTLSYKDRHGKYMNQVGVTLPRIKKNTAS